VTKILNCLVIIQRDHFEKIVTPAIRIAITFQDLGLIPGLFRSGKCDR